MHRHTISGDEKNLPQKVLQSKRRKQKRNKERINDEKDTIESTYNFLKRERKKNSIHTEKKKKVQVFP